ncbi:MAG: hypothetical protein RMK19_00805 [Bacteroidia bacterium]|nr:hypothetical protein [Bacteroidia bacterium]MDW8014532.1 hypothetical protein [Bacteroidia bacterium]
MRSVRNSLFLIGAGIVGGVLFYVSLSYWRLPQTALACMIIWIGMGFITAFTHWLSARLPMRFFLYATLFKVVFVGILVASLSLLLEPELIPFLFAILSAILILQTLHVIFSL